MEGKLKLVPLSLADTVAPLACCFHVSYSEKELSGNWLLRVVFKSHKCHLYAFLRTPSSSLRACLLLLPKKAFLLIGEISVPFFSVCS